MFEGRVEDAEKSPLKLFSFKSDQDGGVLTGK